MEFRSRKQRTLAVALAVALLASLALATSSGLAVTDREVLTNGGFENGFTALPGCGLVATGWGCFTNGGTVGYAFADDQWANVVVEGKHSQLIELSTAQFAASESDRFAGIYQRVSTVPGGRYRFQVRGLMREKDPNASEDKYRYRVQWGYSTGGSTDWTTVTNWVELPWDNIYVATSPGQLQSFAASFTAPSNQTTLFLRVWKKWGTPNKVLDVNLDAASLIGPFAGTAVQPVVLPVAGAVPVVIPPANNAAAPVVVPAPAPNPVPVVVVPPASAGNVIVIPAPGASAAPAPQGKAEAGVCTAGANLIYNGSFEGGFGGNGAGYYWGAFNNGGTTNFGYHDDTWAQVIHDGSHSQLLEINTRDMGAADNGRFSGIYQVVSGLTPGGAYEFSLWGEMREEVANPGEDPYRYRVEWGYAPAGAGTNWTSIVNWSELPWNDIYVRTAGGPMKPFSAQFQAPSGSVVVGVRAVKKWGTPNRELDVNIDSFRLASCQPGVVIVQPPVVVQPPVAVQLPCATNCGTVYCQSGCGSSAPVVTVKTTTQTATASCTWYTIKRGDTLSKIAIRYGRSATTIMAANGITNANKIYAGQRLCIR